MSGKSMPSLDNIIILSKMLNTEIENILVLDEDIAFLKIILNYRFNDRPVVF